MGQLLLDSVHHDYAIPRRQGIPVNTRCGKSRALPARRHPTRRETDHPILRHANSTVKSEANPPKEADEQVELLQLDKRGIRLASYLTELPPRELLRRKLHETLIAAQARLEGRPFNGAEPE
jgi:hypothetical protein